MNSKLVIFVIACALGVGVILVYAKNNMSSVTTNNSNQSLSTNTNRIASNTSGVSVDNNSQIAGVQNQAQSNNQQNPQNQTQQEPQQQNQTQPQAQQVTQQATQQIESLPTGPITELMIKDLVVGAGPEIKEGDSAEVNYVGTFLDGKKFDSSYDRNQTFTFKVGAGNVIRGWDQGVVGMKVGGKRQLVIPSDLAYGAAGAPGAIPPNTPLAFEIELVAIQ